MLQLTGEKNTARSLPGYAPEIGTWLWALEDTRRRTKIVLHDVHPQVLDWTPPWGGNSIATLLHHIAAIEIDWLYSDVLEQEFPPEVNDLFPFEVRDEQGLLIAIHGLTLDDHVQRLDATRAILLKAFHRMEIQDFRRPRSQPKYEVTPEWVLHHLIQHEAEHRGQIGELLASSQATLG